jgi:glycosyltransferase involved in cell wall biosynthesis
MKITRRKQDIYHRMLYRELDLMLTITHALEQEAKRFIPQCLQQIRTLYYGVAAPTFANSTDSNALRDHYALTANDFVIGLFGRLEHNKGQHLLLKAIAQLKQQGVTTHALIVGHEMQAGYTDELRQLANKLGIAAQIKFAGFTPEPQRLMQACDCVLLASYEETFGLVLPEAMRAGVAVIGSNAGGVPEIIQHGVTGLLFEPKNVANLAAQLAALATDDALKSRLASTGRQFADAQFNNELHFSRLQSIFDELVSAKTRAGSTA